MEHMPADAQNLAAYLKNIKILKIDLGYLKIKTNLFIRQFKGVFKKVVTMPIENEANLSHQSAYKIAIKNKFNANKRNLQKR